VNETISVWVTWRPDEPGKIKIAPANGEGAWVRSSSRDVSWLLNALRRVNRVLERRRRGEAREQARLLDRGRRALVELARSERGQGEVVRRWRRMMDQGFHQDVVDLRGEDDGPIVGWFSGSE
jgi:hypothetical protein